MSHARPTSQARFVIAAFAIGVLASGCGGEGPGVTTDAMEAEWRQRAESALVNHPEANAAQLEVVERSLETGEVTNEDYHARMLAFISCLEDSIVGELDVTEGQNHGLRVVRVGFEVSDDEATENANWAVYERCLATESSLVSDLYLAQPSATAWYERRVQEYLPKVIACLADEGHAPPHGATTDEILQLDNDLSIDDMYRTPCLISTGALAG